MSGATCTRVTPAPSAKETGIWLAPSELGMLSRHSELPLERSPARSEKALRIGARALRAWFSLDRGDRNECVKQSKRRELTWN